MPNVKRFAITVVAIVLTDLVMGVAIGLVVSLGFILNSNLRRPVRRFVERHLGGEVLRIELANQVSFLNRAVLTKAIDAVPRGGHVLFDASNTDYIDPDVLELIREFKSTTAPARGVEVSLRGFRTKYQLQDDIQFVDYSTRELQDTLTPSQVLQILTDGHERFRSDQRLTRDLARQILATAEAQHPLAVVLSCIDSRAPVDLIFDVGLGDILSIRIAGNVTSDKVLGSIEYGCAIAGAKLILVMGHTRCGAVTAAVKICCSAEPSDEVNRCQNVASIVEYIQHSIDPELCRSMERMSASEQQAFVDQVARANVVHAMKMIHQSSETVAELVGNGRVAIVGALYDVRTGDITFLPNVAAGEQDGQGDLMLPQSL